MHITSYIHNKKKWYTFIWQFFSVFLKTQNKQKQFPQTVYNFFFKDENTHTRFLWFTGTFHRRNGFYTVQTVCAIALHLPYT